MLIEAIKTKHGFLIPINNTLKDIQKHKILVEIKDIDLIKNTTMEQLETYKGIPLIDLMLKHLPSDYEYRQEEYDKETLYEELKVKYEL